VQAKRTEIACLVIMAIRLSVGPALAFSDAVSPTTLPSDAAAPFSDVLSHLADGPSRSPVDIYIMRPQVGLLKQLFPLSK